MYRDSRYAEKQREVGREGRETACKPDSFKDCAVGSSTWVKCDGKIYAKNAAAICATAATTTTTTTRPKRSKHLSPAANPSSYHMPHKKGRARPTQAPSLFTGLFYGIKRKNKKKTTTLWTGKAFARLQRRLKPPALSAGPADAQCVNK